MILQGATSGNCKPMLPFPGDRVPISSGVIGAIFSTFSENNGRSHR
jgi:hypothetical protein